MNYDLDYFINKCENIPEENWSGITSLGNTIDTKDTCIMGHCGGYDTEETFSLINVLQEWWVLSGNSPHMLSVKESMVYSINDHTRFVKQPTPKQRILTALYELKSSKIALEEAETIINQSQEQAFR